MGVCKFFQQGNCRFGQSCRFEHIYGSKYSYHAPNVNQNVAPTQSTECTDEQLVNQVQADIQAALGGGQWILSCYAPFKQKYPGINDLSPEEARLFIYEARNSNNLKQAINYMNNLFHETRQKYEQLLQPNVSTIKLLRSLYKGESVTSSFSNIGQTFNGTNSASSIFRRAAQDSQPTAASVFSQGQQSIFNTQVPHSQELFSNASTDCFGQNTTSANVFGSQNQNDSVAKSIFASAVNSSTNQFGVTNQNDPSSLFSSANQNIFGPAQPNTVFNQAQNNSPFGQAQNISPFGQTQNPSPFSQTQNASAFAQAQNVSPFAQSQNTSPFNQGNIHIKTENPASIFGQANIQMMSANNPGIYSNMDDLSEEDLHAFQSDTFELGFVPELPPPQKLCT